VRELLLFPERVLKKTDVESRVIRDENAPFDELHKTGKDLADLRLPLDHIFGYSIH